MNNPFFILAILWKIVCFQKLAIGLFVGGLIAAAIVRWILAILKAGTRRDVITRDSDFIRFPLKTIPTPTITPSQPVRNVVVDYFEQHPDAKDEVMKAYYAYHAGHFRTESLPVHNFIGGARYSPCAWCGRTRELVRWDDLPPQCLQRTEIKSIEEVIYNEEESYFKLLERAEKEVPKLIEKYGLSGETLALLHHTYGYDPDTVSAAVDVPPGMIKDYYAAMELEREKSRAAQVKTTITVRNTED